MLVYHDLLGMMQHPHHAKVTPKFCKQYAAVGNVIQVCRGACVFSLAERASLLRAWMLGELPVRG